MAVHNNENLEKYIELCGSRFLATVFVANEARRLADKYQNVISHAEALSWVLSGCVPKNIKDYKKLIEQRELRPLRSAQAYLANILDEDVRRSVWVTLNKSKQFGHLIYHYEGVYDKYRQARVRVLSNMLWNKMREEDFNV